MFFPQKPDIARTVSDVKIDLLDGKQDQNSNMEDDVESCDVSPTKQNEHHQTHESGKF